MHSAHSVIDDSRGTIAGVEDDSKHIPEEHQNEESISPPGVPDPGTNKTLTLDMLDRIPEMHRFLDLRNDDGSNGIG